MRPVDALLVRKFASFLAYVRNRFDLSEDQEDFYEIVSQISRGAEFRSTNLWVLVFAIFVASIGLNVNSTAVIIGAMLISPLMGPILGIGVAVGINDSELLHRSIKNIAFATAVGVLTSTIYFLISPMTSAQSELLARTSPSIWDVLIALLGGLAGMIAGTRKTKSNVIPGVAIATALMPPLCTAGYGLASWNFRYFFGAFYLYIINCVFIFFGTFLVVKFLKFPRKSFLDKELERKVTRTIFFFVTLTVIPSVYLGYRIVSKSVAENNINRFIDSEFNFPETQVIQKKIHFKGTFPEVEVLLVGKEIPEEELIRVKQRLPNYGLNKINLNIKQFGGRSDKDLVALRTGVIEDLYKKNEALIQDKDTKIKLLEDELQKINSSALPSQEIFEELKAQNSNIYELSLAKTNFTHANEKPQDSQSVLFVLLKSKKPLGQSEKIRISRWLAVRTKTDAVKLITE